MSRDMATWDASECALILIDYQPEMFRAIRSGDARVVEQNVCAVAKAAVAFGIPVVLSTVGVAMGVNQHTIPALQRVLPGVKEIDRSSMNAWEDAAFLKAVKATGKKRLVFGALWTEICLAFPVMEALKSDYEVCFVVDAVGGQSKEEHNVAIQRMIQGGAIPNTSIAMIAEWFRDWKSPLATAGRESLVGLMKEHHADYERVHMAEEARPDSYANH